MVLQEQKSGPVSSAGLEDCRYWTQTLFFQIGYYDLCYSFCVIENSTSFVSQIFTPIFQKNAPCLNKIEDDDKISRTLQPWQIVLSYVKMEVGLQFAWEVFFSLFTRTLLFRSHFVFEKSSPKCTTSRHPPSMWAAWTTRCPWRATASTSSATTWKKSA